MIMNGRHCVRESVSFFSLDWMVGRMSCHVIVVVAGRALSDHDKIRVDTLVCPLSNSGFLPAFLHSVAIVASVYRHNAETSRCKTAGRMSIQSAIFRSS